MTSRKIKRNLNKELMFNKIMPSSLSSVTSEHNNTVNVERAALKSEYVKNDAYEENIRTQDTVQPKKPEIQNTSSTDIKNTVSNIPAYNKILNSLNTSYVSPESQPAPQTFSDVVLNSQPAASTSVTNFKQELNMQDETPQYNKAVDFFGVNPFNNIVTEPVQTPQQFSEPIQKAVISSAPPIPDPKEDPDRPQYMNITKQVLYSKLDEMIKMFKCCDCSLCRRIITLQVLNSVKPEYVYKKPSEVKAMIRENNCTDIDQPIIHAIFDVKANPPHKKS
ncbi:MAG: hypothetical protein E7510_08475 [Ruminococcus sp.]|nr:hypothetical protein [Ruminococcus sp.]MBR6600073.1 hypothetical protein [Oscillospiraceae bacterium]